MDVSVCVLVIWNVEGGGLWIDKSRPAFSLVTFPLVATAARSRSWTRATIRPTVPTSVSALSVAGVWWWPCCFKVPLSHRVVHSHGPIKHHHAVRLLFGLYFTNINLNYHFFNSLNISFLFILTRMASSVCEK
jgi:hypothetical protein